MRKRTFFAGVLVLLLGMAWMYIRPAIIHYRLTLTVDNNGAKVQGSSVVRVVYDKEIPILPSNAEWQMGYNGEAVAVDLGERGVLFALLKEGTDFNSGPDFIALKAFGFWDDSKGYSVDVRLAWIRSLNDRVGEKIHLPFENLPLLVRFRDIKDPTSVERVDPNNLAASFGEGVKLLDATLEITDDAVTGGIEKRLGWLKEFYNKRLDGDRYGFFQAKNQLANDLSSGAFSTEVPHDNK